MLKLNHIVITMSMFFCMNALGSNNGRITLDAHINSQSVVLAFDTGASGPILFTRAAKRLGLEFQQPGEAKMSIAKECLFEFGGNTGKLNFGIIDLPGFIQSEIDGLLGWGTVSQNIVEITHAPNKIKFHNKLQIDPSQWTCYGIRHDINQLVMKMPKQGGGYSHVLIDTGTHTGVSLSPERWQQSIHVRQNMTLSALFNPGKGLLVIEETWEKKLVLEGLTLTEVPVSKGVEAGEGIVKEGLDAIFGLYAISCFSWIIDGSAGNIYVRPNDLTRIPERYGYNRLGAVFVPQDIRTSNALIAHVAESGPALNVGIRNGDVLLKVDDVDVTKWRTDPSVMPLSRFWEQPAGTTLDLVLMRDSKKQQVAVTLQEIFEK